MSDTTNVPDVIRQEAKTKALKIIEANPGCTSYVKPEDLETATLFIPVVSVIKPTPEEFHKPIPNIGIMPKVPLMNLIAEKAGVNILRTETQKRGEYVWVGHSFGEKRQPDGSMRLTDASYEYDAEKRAELDFINDREGKYSSEISKRKHVLENCKFGDQKAATGAQLALIHKLAKIPGSFKTPEELMKGMIVCRVDRNVNGIMADPEMRAAAFLGIPSARQALYGPRPQIGAELAEPITRTVDVQTGEMLQAAGGNGNPPADGQVDLGFVDDDPAADFAAQQAAKGKTEKAPLDLAKDTLRGYLPMVTKSKSATDLINGMLANKDATLEACNNLIDRAIDYVQTHGGKA